MFMHRKYCNILIPDVEEFFNFLYIPFKPYNSVGNDRSPTRQMRVEISGGE